MMVKELKRASVYKVNEDLKCEKLAWQKKDQLK